MMDELLTFQNVSVAFYKNTVVHQVSFSVKPGEILGIVGESGSGKSTILKAAMGILENGGRVTEGQILFQGRNICEMKEKELRTIRGAGMGMIFQDAGASLSPIRTIGEQIRESMAAHRRVSKEEAYEKAMELFEKLHFQDGKRVWRSYPFELSGGMNQRIGIVLAMLMEPPLLLVDEPTSALDVAVQKQVVQEMKRLRDTFGTAEILVTHDIGVVRAMADRVLVLKEGGIVEQGAADKVLTVPEESYTKELLAAVPKLRRNPG